MSAELLWPQYYFGKDWLGDELEEGFTEQAEEAPSQESPSHNEVHDLEAFFWVVVWYCISRGAPATRRSELFTEHPDRNSIHLRKEFRLTFEIDDDDSLAGRKMCIICTKSIFERSLLSHISEYCLPLKSLVMKLYLALRSAHEQHTADGLYEKVIEAFDDAETAVEKLPEEYKMKYLAQQEAEEKRRDQESPERWDWKSPSSKGNNDNANPDDPVQFLPPEPNALTPAGKRLKLTVESSGRADKGKRR